MSIHTIQWEVFNGLVFKRHWRCVSLVTAALQHWTVLSTMGSTLSGQFVSGNGMGDQSLPSATARFFSFASAEIHGVYGRFSVMKRWTACDFFKLELLLCNSPWWIWIEFLHPCVWVYKTHPLRRGICLGSHKKIRSPWYECLVCKVSLECSIYPHPSMWDSKETVTRYKASANDVGPLCRAGCWEPSSWSIKYIKILQMIQDDTSTYKEDQRSYILLGGWYIFAASRNGRGRVWEDAVLLPGVTTVRSWAWP